MIAAAVTACATSSGGGAPFVVVSELAVDREHTGRLEDAFGDRLGEVDTFPGHLGLQVWCDDRKAGRYLMVTWWTSEDAFREYMQSGAHRRSHERVPAGPARPRAVKVDRYSVVST